MRQRMILEICQDNYTLFEHWFRERRVHNVAAPVRPNYALEAFLRRRQKK